MKTTDYAMRVATQLQNEGKFKQAKIIFDAILEAYPTQAYALHLSGIMEYQEGNITAAIELIQQAIASHAHDALFHSNLGEMYRQLKSIDLSIQHGQRAIEIDSNSVTALSNLGIAYYDAEQYEKAEDCHKRALAINPTFSCSLNNMGSIYKMQDKTTDAIAFYQAAINAEPTFIEPRKNLSALFRQLSDSHHDQGDHTEALKHLDHAISIDPTFKNAYISKGNILMEMGNISEAREQFSMLAEDKDIDARLFAHYSLVQLKKTEPNSAYLKELLLIADNVHEVSPEKQEYLYFALGKCHDDLGEWEKAFAYFTQGCNLKRKRINYNSAEQIQITKKLIHTFTKEMIENLCAFANPSAQPILIVGMPRSGTTLVEQIIASHPNVYGAGELTYLLDLIEIDKIQSPASYGTITEKYLAHLQRLSANAKRVTDKMPQNFIIIGLIHALFPNAKIIHVKRNPMDTCLSCYTKLFSKGQDFSYDLNELGQYYNYYEAIINHWRQILPLNAWFEVNYENIIDDIETEAKKLIAYCNLHWDPACLAYYESKRNVRTASFMQVRKPIYTSSINRWKNYVNELAPLINILSSNNKYDQS